MDELVKVTDLDELGAAASGDKILIVDVSDTTDGPQGTSKWISKGNLISAPVSSLTKFTVRPTIDISGTAVLVSNDGEWLINGVSYAQTEGSSFSFSLNDVGNERFVLIIAGTDGNYNTVEGEQSATNPAAPPLPLNCLLLSIVFITDSTITEIPLSAIQDLIDPEGDNQLAIGPNGKLYINVAAGSIPDATESVKGKAQIATEAETISGANDTKIVTPLKLLAVSDALTAEIILKEDALNKVTTFTGNETSTSKFPVVKAILDYFTTSRIKTLLGQASSTVDGWLSSTDWNTFNNKQNVLTDTVLGSLINGFSSKTTPVGEDGFLISNSADSNKAYKVSYTNLSATLKSYFDTLYANPSLIVKRILNNTVETTPLTGTTSETLIYSAPVIAGGTFSTDDYFNFQLTFRKNGILETACTYRVKVSNTNNYATATLIASWQSQRYNTILQRLNLYFKSNGTLNSPVQTSTNTQTDLTNSSVSLTSISLDPTQDIYFFVSAQLTTSTESVTMNAIKIFN